MAINKSDPNAVKKLRERVEKEKQKRKELTTNKSESYASNKSDPDAVQKLREKVIKQNPNYRSSAPLYKGSATLPSKESSVSTTMPTTTFTPSASYTNNRNKGNAPKESTYKNERADKTEWYREEYLPKTAEKLKTEAQKKAEQAKAKNAWNATPYTVKTDNAYSDTKSKIEGTITVAGDLTEEERKARINEIDMELRELAKARNGLNRGAMYGNVDDMIAENERKQAELSAERKTLERTGTFTGSETLQFEIDDAKAEVQKWQNEVDKYGSRPSERVASEWQAANSEKFKAQEKLDALEREKTLYKDITEYGEDVKTDTFGGQTAANYRLAELQRDADKAMSLYMDNPTEENKAIAYAYDALVREYMTNNAAALDNEGEVFPWISKTAAGYMPQFLDRIVPQVIGGGVGGLLGSTVGLTKEGVALGAGAATSIQSYNDMRGSVYRTLIAEGVDEEIAISAANDEALLSSLIEGGDVALTLFSLGGVKAMGAIFSAAQKGVAKGSTNFATKFLASLAGKGINAAASTASAPWWKKLLGSAGGLLLDTGGEYGEEFSQAGISDANFNRVVPYSAYNKIGQYGEGNIDLYNRPIYTNEDGTISTVDSVTFEIDGKFVVLPSIVADENGNAVRLTNSDDIVAHYAKTGEYLGKFDTLADANGYANSLHYAQQYHYSEDKLNPESSLIAGTAKQIWDAVTGKNPETRKEYHGAGVEGAKIGLMFGGTSTVVNNVITRYANAQTVTEQNEFVDSIINDEETLNALIEEGKASGKGTVSEKLAKQIEASKEKGEVTREQVKRLIASNEVYIENEEKINEPDTLEKVAMDVVASRNAQNSTAEGTTSVSGVSNTTTTQEGRTAQTPSKPATERNIEERLDALSKANEPITVEEVKKATGFGKNGAELVAFLASDEGTTFAQAKDAVETAYLAGYSGVDGKQAEFVTKTQRNAFEAGQLDRVMDDTAAKAKAQNAIVYDGEIVENKQSKKLTKAERKMWETNAKSLGLRMEYVDRIVANKIDGVEYEANARYSEGEVSRSVTSERTFIEDTLEETLHRMEELATDEYNVLANALFEHAEQFGIRIESGISAEHKFDSKRELYDGAGLPMNTRGYMGEVVTDEVAILFKNPQEYNRWYAKLEANPQVRSAWQKFVDFLFDLVEKVNQFIETVGMTKEEKAAFKKELAEIERFRDLYGKALKASEKKVQELQAQKSNDTKAQKNTDTTDGADFSLKYDYSKNSFSEQIEDYLNPIEKARKKPARDSFLVGGTPKVFTDIGFNALPVTINKVHIDYALNGTKDFDHEVFIDVLKKIPEALKSPIIVMESETVPGRAIAVLKITAKNGKKLYLPIEIDGTATNNGIQIDSNAVTSLFGKGNVENKIKNALNNEVQGKISVFYWNKKEAVALLQRGRLQLPTQLPQDGFVHSIRDAGSNIKVRLNNVTESLQFKRWFGDWQNNPKKASKVVNADGTPKVMYHGSPAQFTVFDKNKAKASGMYGKGFYFTDSDSQAKLYGNLYAVYLNVKHPLERGKSTISTEQIRRYLEAITENEDYSIENYGTYDVSKILEKIQSRDAFAVIQDINATAIGDFAEAIRFFNEINGTKFDGIVTPTETVVFEPNQIKSATDNIGTFDGNNPDIRFSLKKPVEETKDLIAVHNVWENKLREALELGGLPSPSIAITKKDFSHDNFGDISLIFRKETISPTDRRNKVYGGDAYTPTRQQIDYKISDKVLDKLAERVKNLVDYDIRSAFWLMLDDSNVTNEIRRADGNFVEAYKSNEALKIAFLKDKGIPFKPVMKIKQISQTADNVVLRKVSRAIGEDTLKKAGSDSKLAFAQEPMIRKLMNDRMEEQGAPRIYDEELSAYQVSNIIYAALDYIREGEKKTVDYNATRDRLTGKFTKKLTAEYEKWLAELGEGVVEKKGIRNEVDLFTPSGNRRSFEALHWDYTLENIVRSMNAKQSKGDAVWGGNVFGASTKEYGSIAEIKADSSRLQQMTDEEYEGLKSEYKERLSNIAQAYSNGKSYYDAEEALIEAIATKKTKQGMRSYLSQFEYVYKVTDDIVNDLWELRNDIAEMPVSYFEAKPQRAVSFNEVAAAVIPKTKDKSLKAELEAKGINVLEYDKSKDGDRAKKLNSVSDVAFSLKENNNTNSKDVDKLLDTIKQLKHEFELTKFAKADPKKLASMTRKLIMDYDSQVDYDETFKAIDELYTYIANGEDGHPAVWEDVYSKASEIADRIVDYALVVDDELYREYKGLREYLRTTPMRFFSEFDDVPMGYENFNDFRRKNFGRFNFTNNGTSIDRVYEELAELYPEFFNGSEQLNVASKLERMVDVLDEIQPREYNPYSSEFKTASSYLANDIINRFFDIPQAKPTFADKAERKLIKTHIEAKKKLDKVRAQRDAKIQKEKQKRKDAISKMSEKQKAKVLRARIMRHASDLSKKLLRPTDNQHIPQNLQGAVATLLEHINLESNYTYDVKSGSYRKNDEGLPSKRTAAFSALKEIYQGMETTLIIDPDLTSKDGLLSDVIALGDKRIADMTSVELETVWQTMKAIEATISTVNKLFSDSKFAAISEIAEALRTENAGKNVKKELRGFGGKIQTLTGLNMLTPETYFHYLGEAGDTIFRMMRDAQDKHISIMKEVADFTHDELKGVNVNKLEKTLHTVTLGGENVTLTTAQLMELYVLMKRKQAVEHILIGGILPDEIEKGMFKNNRAEPVRNISQAEIGKALSKLTDEEKAIADKMQKFVSTVLSQYGNEASMKVYNYEKFLEENYWTIRTNKQEIASDISKDTAVITVANKGMAKGTVPHANTSVRIGSIFDTFSAHSSDMATYAAWLGTTEDINRIRNFVFWEDGARTGTVKGIIDTVHGTQGSQYLHKLLSDISIGVRGVDNMNPLDKLTGHYKAASVGANIRVIIQQPTAMLRALDMLDAQYLAIGTARPLKGWAKAKKYAPIAQWKDWGHFDINTGRQMKDVLFDNASLLEKTKQVGMWGASTADSLAWGHLWNAVEAETKAKHKDLNVGSEEYYKAVAKRFTEIVDHTQVVDGILQRSGAMRGSDTLTKMATSFMGEPTKQYNMAMSAAYDARTKKGKAKTVAIGRLGRTAIGLAVAGIVNACMQSFIDAMRDDDKEKDYWGKWLEAFVGDGENTKWYSSNLANTFNPVTYVPFLKDVFSIMQGYDVKRMDMESITKTVNAITDMYKAVTGTGKYTIAKSSANLFAEIARLYGVPVANLKRDVMSLVISVAIETDNYRMQYLLEKGMLDINYSYNRKNFIDILFKAYNNDKAAYEFIYKDLLKNGYDAETIQSGMESRLKKAEGVEKASELSKRYMTPADEKKYDNSLKKIKTSDVWKSANAEQKKNAESDLYNFLTSTSDGMEKLRTEAISFGVDETEYTLWQLAKEMVDNGNGSIDAKEKAKAVEMLDFGNSELAYFYGTKTSDEAFAYGLSIENFAMFKAAVSDLKGEGKDDKVKAYAQKYADNEKEYLFFMGTEYSSYKKRSDYIKYFGK